MGGFRSFCVKVHSRLGPEFIIAQLVALAQLLSMSMASVSVFLLDSAKVQNPTNGHYQLFNR